MGSPCSWKAFGLPLWAEMALATRRALTEWTMAGEVCVAFSKALSARSFRPREASASAVITHFAAGGRSGDALAYASPAISASLADCWSFVSAACGDDK